MNYARTAAAENPAFQRTLIVWLVPAFAFAIAVIASQVLPVLQAKSDLAAAQEKVAHTPVVADQRPMLRSQIEQWEAVLSMLYTDRVKLAQGLVPILKVSNVLPNDVRLKDITVAPSSGSATTVTGTLEARNPAQVANAARVLERHDISITAASFQRQQDTVTFPVTFTY